jgi:hypothetical protein
MSAKFTTYTCELACRIFAACRDAAVVEAQEEKTFLVHYSKEYLFYY